MSSRHIDIKRALFSLAARLNVRIRYKDSSTFMKLLGILMFFNSKFMTRYTTTITFFGKSYVYFPSRAFVQDDPQRCWRILAHELVHAKDAQKSAFFNLLYLSPQILAVGSLLSFLAWVSVHFLWCLAFLIFLAPIPSPWRKKAEIRGYAVSMVIGAEAGGSILSPERFVGRFTTADYYFMWPFRKSVLAELHGWKSLYESGKMGEHLGLFNDLQIAIRSAVK